MMESSQDSGREYQDSQEDIGDFEDRPAKRQRREESSLSTSYTGSQDLFASSPELTYDTDDEDELLMDSEMEKSTSASNWDGVTLESLYIVPSSSVDEQYPPVSPSRHHTVCVSLPLPPAGCPTPNPPHLRDVWDETHVRMPWSKENLYPVDGDRGRKVLCSRWDLVVRALSDRRMKNSEEMERKVMEYNTRYEGKADWSFRGLHAFFSEVLSPEETCAFFDHTLPSMVDLLVMSPQLVTRPLPLLTRGTNASITLSQQQIAALLVNAFFCTFPRRNVRGKGSEYSSYPDINFNRLFGMSSRRPEAQAEKLKCLFNYFRQVVTNPPTSLVTFTRQSVPRSNTPRWSSSNRPLPRLYISSKGTIEDNGEGMLQVDFANAMVGGGVLGQGLVQEEIRFTVSPELIVSRLFTQRLEDNEVLIISGVERFSNYTGYADTFEFTGPYCDTTGLDSSGRRYTSIVAMDALHFSRKSDQYTRQKVDRELAKAYAGFQNRNVKDGSKLVAVATGNWGCGAFGGDPRLKALLQLVAAGEAGRDVAYFTFGDDKLRKDVFGMYTYLVDNKVNVGSVYKAVVGFCRTGQVKEGVDFYDYLYQVIGAEMNPDYDVDTDDSRSGSRASDGRETPSEIEHVLKPLIERKGPVGKDINSEDLAEKSRDSKKVSGSGWLGKTNQVASDQQCRRPSLFEALDNIDNAKSNVDNAKKDKEGDLNSIDDVGAHKDDTDGAREDNADKSFDQEFPPLAKKLNDVELNGADSATSCDRTNKETKKSSGKSTDVKQPKITDANQPKITDLFKKS